MAGRFTVETVFKGTDQTSSVLGAISSKTKAFQRALSGPSSFADKGIGVAKKLAAATAFAGAGAVGLGLAFKGAIDPGADFDQQMSAVGAVSLMTRDQVSDLEKEARRLGKTTKFSATEVAGGMELMGKAGFNNGQIIQGIGPLLSAAAAEGMAFEETASVVSNVLKGMGMQMSDTGRIADVLTLASARTNSSISSLGESMAIVAPTARQLKVPLEDATAAVAMLQDQGLDASVAGSAVATMLTNLSKPPKEIAAKMKAMGVSFQDAKGDMLPFREVVAQLAKAGSKAGGNMAQIAFFADLVGMRGQKAALNFKDIGPALAQLTTDLSGAKGSAEKMAALKMDNFLGDVTLLGNEVKDLGIDFFDLVKGPLRNAAQGTRAWLQDNQELIKTDVKGWVSGIVTGIGDMRQNLEKGVMLIGWFKDGLDHAFKHSASVAVFGTALKAVFGGNDSEGPGKKAYDLGYNIGYAVDKFILFTGVVKTAEVVLWGFSNVVKIAKGIQLAYNLVVTGAKAVTVALGAAELVTAGSTATLGTAMTAATIRAGAMAAGEEAAAAATTELAVAENAAAVAGGKFAALRGTLNDTFGSVAGKAGLAAAAISAVAAAYDQFQKFEQENGGWEGVKGFFGQSDNSNNWGFEGVNDVMNAQARKEAAQRDAATPRFTDTPQGADMARKFDRMGMGGGDAAAPPPVGPIASTRDQGADATARSNDQLRTAVDALAAKFAGGGGTVKLILPKGATAEVSGAPGVEVQQSGGF